MANGIVNVYKEKGFTSFDVVAKMRGIMHQKKIGHTGTLDPDAEGVLPVCLGRATKVCDLLTDKDKIYETVLLLGTDTDTQDISGQVLHRAEVNVDEETVKKVILSFVGKSSQIPPMYSALKVNGQKLYDLARQGITVERKARPIEVFSIEIQKIDLPEVHMRIHCSKGTYIRTICHDIGERLGCFGCMKSLLRTKVSVYELKDALTLGEIEERMKEGDTSFIQPVDQLFLQYPSLTALPAADKLIANGNKLPRKLAEVSDGSSVSFADGASVRLYDSRGAFVGIFAYREREAVFGPVKIFME